MSFFRSLFKPTWEKCRKRGDDYFGQDQWGRARSEYKEALRTFESKGAEDDAARLQIRENLGIAEHKLMEMHIELANQLGKTEPKRAAEHLAQAIEFAPESGREAILDQVAKLEQQMSRPVQNIQRAPTPERLEDNPLETFNVLLSGMDDERADIYEAFGENFRTGYLAMMEGDLATADLNLTPLYEADKENLYLRYELGRLRLNQGRMQEAEDLFALASKQAPDMLPLHHARIEALWGLEQWDRAERIVEQAFAIDDTLLENFVIAAQTCLRSGEWDNGIEILEVGLSLHPQAASLYSLQGMLNVSRNNIPAALESFESVLKLHWNYDYETGQLRFDREAAFMAATLYLQNKLNPNRAEELFRALLASGDMRNRPIFLAGLGQALVNQNKGTEAKPFLIDAAAQLPKTSQEHTQVMSLLDGIKES